MSLHLNIIDLDPVTEFADYEMLEERVMDFHPKILIGGGSSHLKDWDYGFKQIADKCGAILMCDVAQISDLIAAKVILANLYIASV